MGKIVVRQTRRTEIPVIAKIQCSAWRAAFSDIITEQTMIKYTRPDLRTQMLERLFDSETGHMYIAGIDGKACGTLFWKPIDVRRAEIVSMHTLKRVWGAGVGRELMRKALADIYNDGFFSTELWVFRENIRARKFYEKYAFIPTGDERVSIYDHASEICMRRLM